jgi:pimeloyl-ACP methyl ester carboxylesterase
MDTPKHARTAAALAGRGLAVARFDCQGTGLTGGDLARTTLTGRAAEIRAVRDHLRADPDLRGPMVLMGSSFGGAASLLVAARDGGTAALVAWSTPTDFAALTDRRAELAEKVEEAFFEDLAGLDLRAEIRGLSPALLVHGQRDEVVPLAQAFALAELLGRPQRLVVIQRADHPLHEPAQAVDLALAETLSWLAQVLNLPGEDGR